MEISVVVVTLGGSTVFERCLEAIAGGARAPLEVVVVDQSAKGLTAAAAAALAGTDLVHVASPRVGVSRARNEGARRAKADHLVFTDDDCVPDAGWLDQLAAALETTGAAAATGRVLPLDDGTPGLVAVSSRTDDVARVVAGGSDDPPWELGTGGNLLVRRDSFERIGGFDEDFGPGARYRAAEDIRLLELLVRSGTAVAYVPAAVVYHQMKTPGERLRRRFPYGYGMGALAATAETGRKQGLAAGYARMQLRALAGGVRSLSPRLVAEPVLSGAGFAAGFLAVFTPRKKVRRDARRMCR